MDNIRFRVRLARLAVRLDKHPELKQYVEVTMAEDKSKKQ